MSNGLNKIQKNGIKNKMEAQKAKSNLKGGILKLSRARQNSPKKICIMPLKITIIIVSMNRIMKFNNRNL